MHCLGRQGNEVPEIVVCALRLRKAPVGRGLHRVNQVGKLDRILDEENWDVVANDVPVAFLGIKLDREAAHVTGQIGRTLVSGNGRETHETRRLFAFFARQYLGAGQFGDWIGQLEFPMHAVATRVNDAFGNPFVIEVKNLFARDVIFEQLRTARTGSQPVLIVGDRRALRRGHHIVVARGLLVVRTTVG